jgi:hypothetical protein
MCPPRWKGDQPRAVGRCWSTGHLPTGPVPQAEPRHHARYALRQAARELFVASTTLTCSTA